MFMNRYKGVACTLLSAILFGVSPLLAKFCYAGGTNGVTLVFLRGALGLPALFCLMLAFKVSPAISRKEFFLLLPVGVIGSATTTLSLYTAYQFTSVGLATTLHYTYPVLIVLFYAILFRQKPGALKWCALALGLGGVATMLEPGARANLAGIGLSLLSGLSYCVYLLMLDRTVLKEMHFFKLSFYASLFASLTALCFGALTGGLDFTMTPPAWGMALLLSLMIAVGGFCLLQLGINYTDPTTVSILFTVEPITCVLLGVAVLGERMSPRTFFGVVLILCGVLLVALAEKRAAGRTPKAENDV